MNNPANTNISTLYLLFAYMKIKAMQYAIYSLATNFFIPCPASYVGSKVEK